MLARFQQALKPRPAGVRRSDGRLADCRMWDRAPTSAVATSLSESDNRDHTTRALGRDCLATATTWPGV